MKEKWINSERVVSISAFFFLVVAVILGIVQNGFKDSILELIPHSENVILTNYIIPIVHSISCIWCFYQIFRPSIFGECGIMFIESALTILTGTEQLGIFLFYGAVCLFRIATIDHPRSKKLFIFTVFSHFIFLLTTLTHSWQRYLMCTASSVFYLAFFLWMSHLLKLRFSYFLPHVVQSSKVIKEAPGEVLHLRDYGLTERQIKITQDYIHNKISYKELAEKYITSLSSIKKDFSIIFQKFGVSSIQEMNVLLIQYQIEP